jgi:plasmid stabilization system protein ParE
MRVHWTRNALRQLTAIHDFVAKDSERYARGVVDRITRRTEALAQFPRLGAVVPEYDDQSIRELLEFSYRVIYRASENEIEILAVVHGARQLPRRPPS